MRTLLTVLALCIMSQVLFAQDSPSSVNYLQYEVEMLKAKKAAIERRIQLSQDSLELLDKEISETQIQAQQVTDKIASKYAALNQAIGDGLSLKTSKPVNLKDKPVASRSADLIAFIPRNGRFKILGIETYPHYKVEYKGKIGYIESENLELGSTKIYALDEDLKVTLNVITAKYYAPSSPSTTNYVPTSRSTASDPVYDTKGTARSSGGSTIYTGPRGGRYHYSASGKKVYEKKH